MMFKEWLKKQQLLLFLRDRGKKNDVAVYFDNDNLIFVKTGKHLNKYFAVRLPKHDIEMIHQYLLDGSFLIYSGVVQSGIYNYVMKTRWKWRDIVTWED